MPLQTNLLMGMAVMLGLLPPGSGFAKTPAPPECPYQSPSRLSEIRPSTWIVLGKVTGVRTEFTNGCCVGGDAEGSATVRIAHIFKAPWKRDPYVVFRWRSAWSDAEPAETGLKPHMGDRLVVWGSLSGPVGYTLAACLADLDERMR
jgi:hypothetical protein